VTGTEGSARIEIQKNLQCFVAFCPAFRRANYVKQAHKAKLFALEILGWDIEASVASAPLRSFGCAQSERSQIVGFANSRLLEGAFELTFEASIESAPSQSFGCAQPEERNIGCVLNSRLLEGYLELTFEASIESAPSQSFGCVQPEERNIGCVLNSRLHCATRMGIPSSGSKPTGP